jgi:hypothetical protein
MDNTALHGVVSTPYTLLGCFERETVQGGDAHSKISKLKVTPMVVGVASTHQAPELEHLGRFEVPHDRIC